MYISPKEAKKLLRSKHGSRGVDVGLTARQKILELLELVDSPENQKKQVRDGLDKILKSGRQTNTAIIRLRKMAGQENNERYTTADHGKEESTLIEISTKKMTKTAKRKLRRMEKKLDAAQQDVKDAENEVQKAAENLEFKKYATPKNKKSIKQAEEYLDMMNEYLEAVEAIERQVIREAQILQRLSGHMLDRQVPLRPY